MAEGRDGILGNLVGGPALVVVATMCLWHNEGRFDYYQAARKTTAIESPELADPNSTSSYTGELRGRRIAGKYVTEFAEFYEVNGNTEIYSWERHTDDEGRVSWSKGWHSHLQSNSRNGGLVKRLEDVHLRLPEFQLDGLEINSPDLHFADETVAIGIADLSLSQLSSQLGIKAHEDDLYLRSSDSSNGELGDERIRFHGVPAEKIATYFGQVDNSVGSAKQFDVKSGMVSSLISDDGILHHVVNGDRKQALDTVKSHQKKLKWIVRLAGTAAAVGGFLIFFSKFLHFLIAIPVIGQLVEAGVFLVSLALGATLSLITIASSLLVHRPLAALLPLTCIALVVWFFLRKARRAKAGAQQLFAPDEATPRSLVPDTASSTPTETMVEITRRVFCDLVRLALVDGKLDTKENDFLVKWARVRGLGDQDIVNLFEEAKKAPGESLKATGRHDFPFLVSLAMIDGYMSPQELHHIISAGQHLGMDRSQINQMITKVQHGDFKAGVPEQAA